MAGDEHDGAKRNARGRLDERDWILAARKVLARQGIDAVRIERLAKQLNISRGSFYWHFADREALLDRVLEEWRQTSTLEIIERLEATGQSPQERLRSLLEIAFRRTEDDPVLATELAIRQWGRVEEKARRALEEVDRLRLRYFARLFEEIGFDPDEARIRAVLANSFMRVAPSFPDSRGLADLDDAIGLLAAR